MSEHETVIVRESPAKYITTLRINRPDAQNAFNFELLDSLETHLLDLQSSNIRALILTGTGGVFCSGADLKLIADFSPAEARAFSLRGHEVLQLIERFPAPVIAAVNGYALGGGCELACACDLRYTGESAKWGQPEAKVGMITGWGGTFRLPRIIGVARAKELIFTAKMIDARVAREIGLVNEVFPDEELRNKTEEIAGKIARNAPIANQLSKRMLNRYWGDTEALRTEESLALSFCVTTEDQSEGVNAFLEKRSPEFRNH
ncbi:MAG TPA: enoyl-CoA hydratase-related protein [bacterium]|nr:enoyl-CoA hydratase-related protein [bacterium]